MADVSILEVREIRTSLPSPRKEYLLGAELPAKPGRCSKRELCYDDSVVKLFLASPSFFSEVLYN